MRAVSGGEAMTEADDDGWRLPVGETLDERRARLILSRFGSEAKRVSPALKVIRILADGLQITAKGRQSGLWRPRRRRPRRDLRRRHRPSDGERAARRRQ